jgi:hypothetical protein
MQGLAFTLLFTLFFLSSKACLAHEGHWDGMGLDEVIAEGKLEIKRLVDDKLLADSWQQSAKFNYDLTDGLVNIQSKRRWVLAYTNLSEKNSAKKTIRIVFTPMGKFIGFEFIETTAMPRPQDP